MRCAFSLYFLLLCCVGFAQVPKFYHLDNTRGLSQNSVYDVVQDQQGFIWAATENGLNRFDGLKFRIYQREAGTTSGLSNNHILHLLVSRKGTLWLATNGNGISKFNSKTEKFTHYSDMSDQSGLYVNNAVWSIAEDRAGKLWLGTFGGGLKEFDPSSGKYLRSFKSYASAERSCNDVRSVCVAENGRIWLGTFDGGLVSLDPSEGVLRPVPCHKPLRILKVLPDPRNRCLWLATYEHGMVRYDLTTGVFTEYASLNGLHVRDVLPDPVHRGVFWLATWGKGVARFSIVSGSCEYFGFNEANPLGSAGDLILSLFADRTGLIWSGTYNHGLDRINTAGDKFRTLDLQSAGGRSNDNVVYSLAARGKDIYVGTHGNGAYRVDEQGAVKEKLLENQLKDYVGYSFIAENDQLWIGTSSGVFVKNNRTGAVNRHSSYPTSPDSLSHNEITAAMKDATGTYWFGTYGGGLNRFDAASGKFRVFKNRSNDRTSLPENTVYTIFEDSRHRLWVGTGKGGLCLLDRTTGKFTRITQRNLGFGQTIHSIAEDRSGAIWVATPDGLYRIEGTDKLDIRSFSRRDGLSSNFISAILIDKKDRIWISTSNGICRLVYNGEKAPLQVNTYGSDDGIGSMEFLYNSSAKTQSGMFCFGGLKGVTVFNPDEVTARKNTFPVVFTGFSVFNEPVKLHAFANGLEKIGDDYYLPGDISRMNEIRLSYRESVFSFDFAALDYLFPRRNRFAYCMEGFDRKWNYIGTRNSATYTSLPPGEYVFRVKAANSDGAWSPTEARIRIVITPPWWATWWFRISSVGFIVIVTIVLTRRRINKLKRDKVVLEKKVSQRTAELSRKNEQLEEMDKFKQSLTTMLVHDLKNPLGSIVAGTNDSPGNRMIGQSARQMLSLVMNLLEVQKMKDSRMHLNIRDVEVSQVIGAAIDYVSLSATQKNIAIEVIVRSVNRVHCDSELIERVLINLLSNAIYYSPENEQVTIEVNEEDKSLVFSVSDKGKGMEAKQLEDILNEDLVPDRSRHKYSSGIGLQYCKWALAGHGSVLRVEKAEGGGSRFVFSLPSAGIAANLATVPSPETQKTVLSAADREMLRDTIVRLQECRIYEGGRIQAILKTVKSSSAGIENWKQEVLHAVFSLNENKFRDLCNDNTQN
ncbi:MAG: two-component regulator propeller domain-containing protein [Bacteroidota bacterium]